MIFTARQLQEKCQEQNVDLCMTLPKAFDPASLWKIMARFGCPARFTAVVRQFLDSMLTRVQNAEEYSEPFLITNGVKEHGHNWAWSSSPCLQMLFKTDDGFPSWYRLDGNSLRRLQAKSKVQTGVLDELLYADDMAKNVFMHVDRVSQDCNNYDLKISTKTKKTEVVYQPAPGKWSFQQWATELHVYCQEFDNTILLMNKMYSNHLTNMAIKESK